MKDERSKREIKGLEINEHELAVLAFFADIGVKVIRTQWRAGQIPEEKMQMVEAMLDDASAIMDKLEKYAEEKQKASG